MFSCAVIGSLLTNVPFILTVTKMCVCVPINTAKKKRVGVCEGFQRCYNTLIHLRVSVLVNVQTGGMTESDQLFPQITFGNASFRTKMTSPHMKSKSHVYVFIDILLCVPTTHKCPDLSNAIALASHL